VGCVVVIPARRSEQTIGATLESLRLGNASFVERVLVVTSRCDPTAEVVRRWSERDPRVELVLGPAPRTAGAARNAGRQAASEAPPRPIAASEAPPRPMAAGEAPDLLLFVDADCRLDAGGARRLADELERRGAAAICARVLGDGALVARARHILEFKEAASRRSPPPAWLPPSTAMLCRSEAFDRCGGFPDLWPGEDLVFSQTLRDQGARVLRSDDVVVHHQHPRGIAEMLRHQARLGSTAAIARMTRTMPGSAFTISPWHAVLLMPARMIRIAAWQLGEGRAAFVWCLLLAPLLVAGLFLWTSGFVSAVAASGRKHRRSAVQPA